MALLQLDVRVVPPAEQVAQQAMEATRLLGKGDRDGAERLYRDAAALPATHGSSWTNLAALCIGLGDSQAAHRYATRAVQWDRANADAWVNLGAASWHTGLRRDAAQATYRALELAPGMEAAALNLSLMYQAVEQPARARGVLAKALARNPGAVRLQQSMAEICRLLGDADASRTHALAALAAIRSQLRPTVEAVADATARNEADDTAASARVQQVLFTAQDALDAAGLRFHLIGGTLLAIHRDGRPFPHDKDIDLGLPFNCDRDAVASAFSEGFRPALRAEDPNALASRRYVMGFKHLASGIGVDLMFVREQDGIARFELGWPDHLACEMPAYPLQLLQWAGREWHVPAPPSRYLEAIYGPDWNGTAMSRGFDRRWFDTQISNPSRTPDSLPRAVTLVLLRLLHALQGGQWNKARALCIQILAREPLVEVQALLARIEDRAAA